MASIFELGSVCRDEARRADVKEHPTLNGIDFVEYERRAAIPQHVLVVTFLKPLPDAADPNPDGAYGLTLAANLNRITIFGGTRIVNIRPVGPVQRVGDKLEIPVSEEGDFSIYQLGLGWTRQSDDSFQQLIPEMDIQFSVAPVNFKAGCPTDFDCRPLAQCPPEAIKEPLIDYLAKDYSSFRRLLIDLIPQLNPNWLERNPSDLGIALLELLAYEGDYLSYFQDAVANEAYLDTVRQRASAKKHSRLIDYPMHDGRNAWTFVHFGVGSGGQVPLRTKILSRITAPLRQQSATPGVEIPEADLPPPTEPFDPDPTLALIRTEPLDSDPALAQVRVFETTFPLDVSPLNNEIYLHTWGNVECCLPKGQQTAYLYTLGPIAAGERQALLPDLRVGDFLLLEELMGPKTGAKADADPTHRQVVRLVAVTRMTPVDPAGPGDPVYRDKLTADGRLQVFRTGDTPLPLLHVTWRREDALQFPLCISARNVRKEPLINISVARGNMVLADHGLTIRESFTPEPPVPDNKIFRHRFRNAALTMQCQPDTVTYNETTGLLVSDRLDLTCPVRKAQPAIALLIDFPTGRQFWQAVPDLLASSDSDRHFTVEVDAEGRPTVRFGDDEYGRRPFEASKFTAIYRVGNGRAGNVGAEAMVHAVRPAVAPLWPAIARIRNPLAAQQGTDPETIEEVRQHAPAEFRAEQFRAVVESDYAAAARKLPQVAGAVASFRWTGSWYTVFVGVDPRDPDDIITEAGGRTRLAPRLLNPVRDFLKRYKLAGYDLEIRSPEYVPLEIALELCVEPDHFRGDVAEAVRQALSSGVNADGSRGFFHPDNFTFGQPVYLSGIYAAIEAVRGVDSAFVTIFRRFGKLDNGELASGILPIGPWEISRLDNDPSFKERGVIRITAGGGK